MKYLFSRLFFIFLFFTSCSPSKITGLWIVESVSKGEEQMTPIARWVQLNEDGTQISGNGWVQHSEGTWRYDKTLNSLEIVNTNGLDDPNPPFSIASLSKEAMQWQRVEEGMPLSISLKQSNSIPKAPGDGLLGLWKLTQVLENGNDLSEVLNPTKKYNLLFRWDRIFTLQNTAQGRQDGTYRVHGHKPELELTYYGDPCQREYWSFQMKQDKLHLTAVNQDANREMIFVRINTFPQ